MKSFIRGLSGCAVLSCAAAFAGSADPDTTFNGTGTVVTPLSGRSITGQSVAMQPDGKILVAGYSAPEGSLDTDGFILVRYLPNGTLDPGFGTNGKVQTAIQGGGAAHCVRLQKDGRILVAGSAPAAVGTDFALVRYLSDGTLDLSFNGTGKVVTPVSPYADVVNSLAIMPDGRIVAGGTASDSNGTNDDFVIVRYLPGGTPDTTFNSTGTVIKSLGSQRDNLTTVLVQPDGRIVAAGSTQTATGNDFAAVRYTSGGQLDNSFSGDGIAILATAADDAGQSAVLQPDGKIVIAGYVFGATDADFAVVRLLGDGSPDSSFNGTGRAVIAAANSQDMGQSVALQNDGKLVIAGFAQSGLTQDFAFVRLLPGGTPDSSFNSTGRKVLTVSAGLNFAQEVALQEDGKIIAAGFSDVNFTSSFVLVRLTGDPASVIAVEQPAGAALVNGSQTPVSFGTVATGSSGSVTFQIRNAGGGSLTGVAASFGADGNPADFQVETAPAATVAPGGSAPLTIRFQPSATGTRTATLLIASNDLSENPFTIKLTGTGASQGDAWRQLYFGSPANSGAGADLNDADGDGVVNLLEFATGGHPVQRDAGPIVLIPDGASLIVRYRRRVASAAEVSLQLESSDSLGAWTPVSSQPSVVENNGGVEWLQVILPSSPRRFLRLKTVKL